MQRVIENPEWRRELEEWVERTCREQGVPVKVTDPATLQKVAVLMGVH